MEAKSTRLFFIDAMRAWAILMMLQGHFVDGLLDTAFRDDSAPLYAIWKYFRGVTAPVFFTVSGFIFTYLLLRAPEKGRVNPRVRKGLRRGLQLVFIGYLLRTNLFGLWQGQLYDAFYLVDVLHCIGLSIIGIIGLYLLAQRGKPWLFPLLLVSITVILFLLEPVYKQWSYPWLPDALANYLTKTNGSVFTIIPWLGYTAFGGFLSMGFARFKDHKHLYPAAIGLSALSGFALVSFSSPLFLWMGDHWGMELFVDVYRNNYLFIRLGDVLLVFAVFMLLRQLLARKTLVAIGQNTLSIYVIHFIILYGSFTGLGLYRFFHHELTPYFVIPGAALFMVACTYLALMYDRHEQVLQLRLALLLRRGQRWLEPHIGGLQDILRTVAERVLRLLGLARN